MRPHPHRRAFSAALLCVVAGHAAAADIYVSLAGDDANPGTEALPLATIDAAVAAASAGDTIFLKPGLYEGPEHRYHFIDFDLTFVGDGPAGSVICSGADEPPDLFSSTGRFLQVTDASVSARNIVFRDFASRSTGSVFRVIRSSINIESSEFLSNRTYTQGGGAIWLNGSGSVTITDSHFSFNNSDTTTGSGFELASVGSSIGAGAGFGGGAGAGADGEPTVISGCTFTGEGASITITSQGPITMTDCVVTDGRGDVSAVTLINDVGGVITVEGCIFESNTTLDFAGGGDDPAALDARADTILIDRSVFFRNFAMGHTTAGCYPANGGAARLIAGTGNTVEVRNSLFVGNEAPFDGPYPCMFEDPDPGQEARGNAISANRLRVTNCTFAFNQDLDLMPGSSTDILAANPIFVTESVTIENSIFFEPTGVFGDQLPPTATISGSFTTVDEGFAGFTLEPAPGFVNAPATPAALSASFDDDAFKLDGASPAIDAGDNAVVVGPLDLAGNNRIADGDADGTAIVDLGAYEFRGAPCFADVTGDGVLNTADINAFVQAFLMSDPAADFSADGNFNTTDINLFVQLFLAGCD